MQKNSICYKCGNALPSHGEFCPACGAWVRYETLSSDAVKNKQTTVKESTRKPRNFSYAPLKQYSKKGYFPKAFGLVSRIQQWQRNFLNKIKVYTSRNKPFKKRAFIIVLSFVVVVAGIFVFMNKNTPIIGQKNSGFSSYISSVSLDKPASPLPDNGQIFQDDLSSQHLSTLTVHSSSKSCLVKLKTAARSDDFVFFVRANSTVTVSVPAKEYYVYFAFGDLWYGYDDLFGNATSYSKDTEILDFSKYSYEYSLAETINGNIKLSEIDKGAF